MNKINSLYTFIKETSQKKGRPLKIVSDWDECLQPTKPKMLYDYSPKEKMNNISFPDFFKKFWEDAKVIEYDAKEGASKIKGHYSYILEMDPDDINLRKAIQKAKIDGDIATILRIMRNQDHDFFDKSPFLSIAEELLQCLKENLIRELIITSSRRAKGVYAKMRAKDKRKEQKYNKSGWFCFAHSQR